MAASLDGDKLFLGWPHCGRPEVSQLHAGRAVRQRHISPCYPGGGREALVFPPASLIVTGNTSRACLPETPHLYQP